MKRDVIWFDDEKSARECAENNQDSDTEKFPELVILVINRKIWGVCEKSFLEEGMKKDGFEKGDLGNNRFTWKKTSKKQHKRA
jgi:hypothetical protein